jgi:integrase
MAINKYETKSGELRYKATLWRGNRPVRSKSFRRKIDATQWLSRENAKEDDQKVGRLKGLRKTLTEFFTDVYLQNTKIRDSTRMDYVRIFNMQICPALGNECIGNIDSQMWSEFLSELKRKGMGCARANRVHAVASAIYALALRWDYVHANPLLRVDWEQEEISGENKYWTLEELSSLLNHCYESNKPLAPFYHFLYETGLRISEAQALEWDCINFESNTIEIRRAYSRMVKRTEQNTKSGKKRTIVFSSDIREVLLKQYNSRYSEFVFCKVNGEALAYETVRAQLKKDATAAGVLYIGVHGFRHTFASHYVMRGGNIYDLRAIMGHASIETTMGYAHLSAAHLASKASLVQFRPQRAADVIHLAQANHSPTIEKNQVAIESLKEA